MRRAALILIVAGCAEPLPEPEEPVVVAEPEPTLIDAKPTSTAQPHADAVGPASALDELAAKHAAGMQPLGDVVSGEIGKGVVLRHPLSSAPGKCYTIIVVSTDIDNPRIALRVGMGLGALLPPGLQPTLLESTGKGGAAIAGAAPNCFKNALPLPMPLTIEVSSQSTGRVRLRVFVK